MVLNVINFFNVLSISSLKQCYTTVVIREYCNSAIYFEISKKKQSVKLARLGLYPTKHSEVILRTDCINQYSMVLGRSAVLITISFYCYV
jgi:hypothetical protein